MKKYYYAVFHPEGLGIETEADELMRFESASERDEVVDRVNGICWWLGYDRAEPVTEQDASARFDLDGFGSPFRGVRTIAGKIAPSIKARSQK